MLERLIQYFSATKRSISVDGIFADEKACIDERRRPLGYVDGNRVNGQNFVGLALSGGGIRSATFCFGVLQVLEEKGLMRYVDYFSTVSGGGYAGSAYSAWKLRQTLASEHSCCPTVTAPPQNSLEGDKQEGGVTAPETSVLAHLRKFSNYLSPRSGIGAAELWRVVGTMFRNLTLHWVVLTSAVVSVFAGVLLVLRSPNFLGFFLGAGGYFIWTGWRSERRVKKGLATVEEKRKLLQAPRSSVFFGMALWALGIALAFVRSTYYDPRTGAVAAAVLILLSITVVSVVGVASEWRWSAPRRNFWPRWAWCGFLFVVALPSLTWWQLNLYNHSSSPNSPSWAMWSWVWQVGLVLVVLGAIIGIVIAAFSDEMSREELEWSTRLGSTVLVTALAWMALTGLTLLSVSLAAEFVRPDLSWPGWSAAVGGTGLWAGLSGLAAYLGKNEAVEAVVQNHWKRIAVAIGPPLFMVGLVLLTGFISAVLLIGANNVGVLWQGPAVAWLFVGACLVFVAAGFALDANEFSLHGFYRDRLVRCYLGACNAEAHARDSVWNIYTDDLPLHCLRYSTQEDGAPFHIINTAVNLFGSNDLKVRQRDCDSFFLTPLHCGSGVTGFAKIPKQLYLGTAMAVSGAAVGSAMGLGTRGAGLAALMTFLNLRLGYWFGNPGFNVCTRRKRPPFAPMQLFAEAFSLTNEYRSFVNLSDGGHFDNLGLYELIRRRCRFIIVVDAECDERYTFGSLAQVIRLARIDFNVEITLTFQNIAPRSESERYAQMHWALGRIDYSSANEKVSSFDNNAHGQILYVKSSLLCPDDEFPGDVLGYATGAKTFPHETTIDQFFSEAQFESYRKLGELIGKKLTSEQWGMDKACLVKGQWGAERIKLKGHLERLREAT